MEVIEYSIDKVLGLCVGMIDVIKSSNKRGQSLFQSHLYTRSIMT